MSAPCVLAQVAPTTVYAENFQNRPGPTPIVRLTGYTGTTGVTYTADAAWLTNCNGWIASWNQPATAGTGAGTQITDCGGQSIWNNVQRLAQGLGTLNGQSLVAARDNFAVTAYTAGNPGANLIQIQSSQVPLAIPPGGSSRFITFGVDAAADSCGAAHPLLNFFLLPPSNVQTALGTQIDVCAVGTTAQVENRITGVVGTVVAGHYAPGGTILYTGATVAVRVRNAQGSGAGNDFAIDNLIINDVSPQLTKSFVTPRFLGQTSTLTLTVTNTTDLLAKAGWSFTDTLPAGLTIATPSGLTTTCVAPTAVTATAGSNTITVANGRLNLNQVSCTITLNVTTTTAGTYTNGATNVTPSVGISLPPDASVQFIQPTLRVDKVSVGGVDTFNFSGTNGVAAHAVTTVTAGTPQSGATQNLTAIGSTSVTEGALPAGYELLSIACTGLGAGGTATPNLATRTVTLDTAATMTAGPIVCTYTNRLNPTLALAKTWDGAAINDTASLTATGGTGSPVLGSTANAANETDTGTPVRMRIGDVVTLNETLGGGNVGQYNVGTWNCSAGSVSGNVLTLDPASAGANIVCTITNTRRRANLQVTKSATPPATYLPGQSLDYSITVSNPGPDAAVGISVTDTVPASVTVTGWTCSASGPTADCDTAAAGTGAAGATNAINLPSVSLGVGASLTIAVTGTAQLAATGAIVNTVTATPPASMSCTTPPCAVSATVTNTNGGTPQLSIVKTATPASFAVGQPATYSLQISNSGTTSTAGTISVSDPLPAGITATLPVTAAGWDCSASTATQVNCSTSTVLLPGSNAPVINVAISVAPATANPAVNTATVQGGGDASCPAAAHCSSTTTTPVNAPRLDVIKTLNGNLIVGVTTSYTIQVTNNGTADTLAGTVTDTIPTGLSIGTVSAGCSVAGQLVTCQIPAGLSPGQSISFTTQITPQASTTGQAMTNVAVAQDGGDPTCPAAGHCTGTTTDTVDAPQLSLVKTASPDPFVVGVPATYTLTLTNTGTAATTAVTTVSDTIPGGLTIGTLPASCSATGQIVTCTVAAGLATGTPVSFAIPVTPQASLSGLSVTNNATATGGGDPSCPTGADPSTLPARCLGTTTTNVNAPRLDIVKSASGANFVVGVAASYTLQVSNGGSAATTSDVTVTDVIPADLIINSAPGCSITGQSVTCTIAAPFNAGATTSFTVNVTPTAAASGQTLANTATVQGGGDPTCPTDTTHCSSTVNVPVNAPQLTITKTASAPSFVVGVAASYTLQVTNTGTAATTAVTTVSDTIPGTLTIGTPLPADCTASGQVVTCTIATGFAVGANVSFVIPVTPTAAANGTTVANTATVSGGGDPTCPADTTHCSSTTNTPVNAPQLTIAKSASGASFVVNVPASYTLQVTNTGTAATTALATVSDTLPADLTIGTPLPADCSATGQLVTCTIAAGFAVGANVSFVIPVTPTAAASGQTLTNTATVSGGGDPTCPAAAHCSSTVNVPVNAPQLTVLKTASATSFVVGVPASYTLQVTNTGTADTTAAATVTDTIPASLTPGTAPAGCTITGQNVSCTIATGLAVGANVSFVIPVTPTPAANGTSVVNTATVSGGGDPTCPADTTHCTSTTSTPVNAPQLTIVKSASASNFVVGVAASYTLQITNTGTAATTAVATVSDTIPADLTIGTPLPADCSAAGQVITCTIPAGLATGTPISFVIPVTPTAAASGQTLTNTATVSGGGDPNCPAAANCTSTVNVPVNAPQLTIAKTASAASFVVGVPASYTLQVTNTGTADTTAAATVTDTIPASLTPGAAPAGCTITGQNVSCTIPAGLAIGANVSFVIPVTPTAAANGTSVVNTATVSGGGDPTCPADTTHCTSTTTTPVNAPQLTIVKTASASNFVVGVAASYTLQITNTGTAATTAVATVSDTIPADLTIGTPLPADCSAAGQVITCTIAAGLATGTPVSFVIPVTPTAAASGQTLTNTATVSGGGDPNCPAAANCTSTVNVPVNAPQLTVLKTASATSFVVGVPASYTLQVTNTGTAATTADATVTDTIPASLTPGAAPAGCTITGQNVNCTIPAGLAIGANVSFVIPVTPTPAASGTSVVNTATVSGGGDPTCPADTTHCSSSTSTPVNAPQLTIAKTASAANFVVGVPASYTLQVTNTGTAATTAVATVSDTIPTTLTIGAPLPADCSAAGQVITCSIASGFAIGANVSFVIPVTPTAAASGTTVVNTATVSGGGDPTCPADTTHCSSSTSTPVNAPQLTIAKTASAASFVVGVPASYTLQVTNTGSAATTADATVTDTIPASLTPGTAPAGCTITGQNVSCTIPTGLAVGANVSFVIPVTPTAAAAGTTVSNTATVSGGGDPTCPADTTHCSSTVNVPVDQIVNLSIAKTATPSGSYLPGQALNYSIVVTNNGPSPASGISVTDTVPANVTVTAWTCVASGSGADCDTTAAGTGATGTGNAISLASVALGVGESLTISITGTAQLSATGAIVNTATAAPPAGATCTTPPCEVTSTTTNTDGGAPQLTIAKTATPGAFAVGQAASYALQVSNTGSSSTSGVITVSDPLPAGITTTATPSGTGWDCSASTATQVNCSTIAVLLPGSNAPVITVPVTIGVGTASPAVNTATTSGGGDASCPAAAHCQATTSTPVNAPRLDVTKVLQGNFVVGVQSNYLITVTNNGQADTLAGTITDTIPTGLTIGVLPAGCTSTGQNVTCNLPAGLSAGTSISYTIPVTPTPALIGQSVTNNATANDGGDPTCPAETHCTGTTTDTVQAPQLSIVKSATPTTFVVGVPATYTLQVTNTGTAATTAATTVSDTIPGGLTIGTLPADCSAAGQVVTCTIPSGLATGTPVSFAIPVTPTAALSGLSVTNNATATGGGDPSCPVGSDPSLLPARCIGTTTTPVNAPELTIQKTASAANFVVGVPASYTLQVTNTGTAATTATATVSDTIPADLIIGTPLPTDCSAAGQVITCTIASGLAPGANVSFVIPVTPTAAASGQTLTNTATVSGGGDPSCPGATHCASTVNVPVDAPELTIVKTASAANFVVNVPASYTLQVSNTGTAATTATATVSDTIPGTLTIGTPLPVDCSAAGQVITCSIASGFAIGANVSFVIPVTPTAAASGTTVVNTATVSGGGDPTCPADTTHCSSSTSTPVNAPQLTIVKSASAANFVAGVAASYTLQITNTGTAATTAVATVSDTIPADLTIGTPLPADCSATGQVITCTIAAGLATGTPVSFVIPVTPTAAANGQTLTNTATVSGGGDPTCPGEAHCSSTVNVPVNAPQLTVLKTASAASFVVGVPASYTLQVTNTGTAATTAAATVTDTIPASLTPGTAPAGCTITGQNVSCTIPAGLAIGANVSFVIPVTPTPAASGTTVVNTATVSGGGDPTCPADTTHCTSTTSTPVNAPQLTIAKTASAASFVVGVPASYTLQVTNTGSAATTATATVSDTIPTTLTIGTPLPADCSAAGQVITCSIASGFAIGANVSFVIPVTPTATASGTTVVNTATVSGGGDPTCPADTTHCSSSTSTPVNAPQLTIAKTASAASFVVGVPASYTLQVTNTGSAATTADATVTDTIPASLTPGTAPAGCTITGQNVSCTIPTGLAVGANVSFVIPVTPTAAAAGTTVSNTATVSGGGDPTCPADTTHCSSTVNVPVEQIVNLSIAKTATPSGTYLPGQALNYSIVVTNNGPSPASGISVTDTVPANVTVTAWSCAATGTGADCDTTAAGTGATGNTNAISLTSVALGVGESLTISITGTAQLSATGAIVNTATATPPAGATCATPPCEVTSTTTNTDGGAPQLTIAKTATPGAFAVGQAASYALQVSNTGSSSTVGVITVSDPLPTGITTTATPSGTGWDCSASTATQVNCSTIAVLLPGSNAPVITVPVTIGVGTASPAVNTATTSGGGDASCPAAAHCQATTSTPVNAPRLDVTKVLQGNFVVGVQSNYLITVTNNGQADTLAGTITDTIPTGLTIGLLPAGCTSTGQNVTCNLPAGLSAGTSISYAIPVTPTPALIGQSVTNNATANDGGDPTCPAETHCTGTTTDTVQAPQLSIVKSATPTTFVVGVPATYTLQVTNTGTAATTAVTTVSDTIPGGLTIGTLPADCSAAGQVVTCTIPSGLATGTPVSFAIPVTPTAALSGLSVTNNATATGGGDPSCPTGSDPSLLPARCIGTTTTPVNAPELTIQKTASAANFVVGVPASYTLQVTNTGTAATTATATVSDTIPADLIIGTPLPADCSAAGQVITCTIATGLAPGANVSFVIPVTPTAAASGQTLTNTATVSGGGDPSCPGATHCTSTVNVPVDAPELTIVKTASAANFVVNVPASYTLQVTNTGTAATTAVATVSDTIPGTLTIGTPLPADCSAAGQVLTCTIPTGLAVGANVSFVIPVTPTAAASGTTVVNTATVSGGGDPTCPADTTHCSSSTSTPVNAPQLTIVKSASASNFVVGVAASYTLQITNTGTAATTAVATVSDTIPADLTIGTPLPADCSAAGQVITCTIAAGLATGTPVSFVIPVTPTAAASGQTLTNTATVSGGGDPNCPAAANCTSTVNVPVNAPQLTIAKTASAASFVVGVPASYTLQVTNTGTADTTAAATVTDTIPASLTPGAAPAGCTITGQNVSCTIPAGLAIGANVSFVIPVTPTPAASGTSVVNTATVSGGGDPTCPADTTHCMSTTTTPVNAPQLTIVKTASASNFVVGVAASYTLQITNTGTAATTAVATVSDTIPADLTIGTPLPADCSAAGQVITCTIAAGLATGTPVSFVIPVTPTAAASGQTLTNTATVSGGGDPNCPAAANCTSTVNVPVNAPQLTVLKTASATSFVVGVPASYTLQVTNTGTAATTADATVTDTIPASLTPGTAPAGCTIIGQNVSCTIPTGLAVGASVSFVIPVTPTAAASGTTVVNTATVSGGGDPTCPADTTHCSSSTSTPVNAPQLTITKTASAANFVVNVPASYTLQVSNTGTAATTATATVSDTIPTTLTIGAPLPADCSAAGQVITCSIASGFAIGANVSFVIPVTPTAAASGTTVVNTATVSGGGDPTCPADTTHCSSSTSTPVNAPQLTIAKTASAASFVVGVPASYTLQVTNTGSAATTADATVTDTIPASLTPGTAPAGCTITGQNVSCTIPAGLAVGANVSFVIPVTPTAAAAGTTVSNTATVSGGGDPTCPADTTHCSSTVDVPVEQIVNLTIAKTATPNGSYLPGQSLNYSIVVTNNGPSPASGISVTDTVPAAVTVTGWTCTASGTMADCDTTAVGTGATGSTNTISLTNVALGVGESLTISITGTAQLSATGAIINTATATPPAGATCTTPPCSVTSTTTNTDGGAPQLTIAKTATPGAFAVGQAATYSLQISNTGSSSTVGVITVSDPLPAGITTTATPSGTGWDCSASTATQVNCSTIAVLLPGSNAPVITVPVTIGVGTTSPAVNTATASGGGDASCPAAAHCQATTSTPVNAPRLDVTKVLQGNFVVGVQSNYLITVTNNGQADTLAGTITDTIPTGLTIGILPVDCTSVGQAVTCNLAAGISAGTSVSFTIPVTPTAALIGQSVTNNATANDGGDPTCPAETHCTGTTTDTVQAPQLSIVKSATPTTFVVGVPATYTLQVTNTGTAATTAVTTVSDTIPGGLTIGTLPADCSAAGQVVTCTIPAGLATGTPVSFAIPVTPMAALSGLSVTNNATATGGGDPSCPTGSDPSLLPARCIGTTTTPVNAPELTIQKTASAANFVVGVPASYTLQVTNTGTAATTANATVSDTIPADLIIGTPLPADCSAAGQVITCTIATGLAPGANVSFVIPVTPTAAASGQTLTNTATVSGGGDPSCPGATHCTSTVNVPVDAPELTLVKTASAANFVVNVPASYTLQVTNTGTAATTAVATVSDTIPGTLTIGTPLPADCSAAGQVLTCTIPTGLAVGANVSFVIPVTPTAAASGTTVVNTATVSGGGDPTCPADTTHCSSSTSTPVNAPQLTIVKTASVGNFVVNVPASYTLSVTNTGSAATTAAATVSDTIPASLTIGAPLPADCSAAGQVITCNIATGFAIGANVSFVIPVTPTAAASGTTVVNTATVNGGGTTDCPGAANCSSTVQTPTNAPQLTIVKTASASNFVVGVPASYTLSVTNTGSAATTAAATVSDTIPAALTIGAPLPTDCSAAGQVITCSIATGFAIGANVSFVIPVTPTAAANGTTVVNTATVSGGGTTDCPGAANCSSTVQTPTNAPQLTIVKTASVSNFVVNVPASYTLSVTNTGSAATTAAATVSDTIPAALTIGAPLSTDCSAAGQVITCSIATGFAIGANVSFVIPVTPTAAANGTTVVNTATVSGGGTTDCPGAANCSSTVQTPTNAPQLTIVKTASVSNFVVNVPASYTLSVTNTGSAATTAAATVSDTIPAALTIGAPLPVDCSAAGQVITCNIASGFAIGANVAFVIPVTPTAAANGTTVINTATVSGGGTTDCPGAANCSSTVQTPTNAPQLTIVKTASVSNFVVNVPASYTLSVTNTGSAATTAAATVSDTIPASLTIGAPLPTDCGAAGQVITCTIATGFAVGANVAFVIPVTPTPAASGTTVVNTATVSGGGTTDCPGAANCSSTVQTPTNAPQLTIVKTASVSNFVVNVPASYTLSVTNTGSAATTAAATVSDTIPAALTIGAPLPTDCSAAGQVITCNIASGFAIGANVAFVIPVTPTAAASGTTVVNTATVSGGGGNCPGAANCSSTVQTPVDAPLVTIEKTASSPTFSVGVPASYTLTVTNIGSAATTEITTVTDPVPATLTLGAPLPADCGAAGQTVTCTIAAGLAPNTPVSFVIPVTPTAAAAGTTVVNTATVSGNGCRGDGCGSTVQTPVDMAQLSLTKTATPASFQVGVPASYTLTLTNTGSVPTISVSVISDPMPAGLDLGTLPADCTAQGQLVTCTVPAGLAPGASVSFVLPVTPNASASSPLSNTASVSGDSCPGPTCTSSVDVPLGSGADLAVTKTDGGVTVLAGSALSYTLNVRNLGPSPAASVVLDDPTPPGLSIESATAPCTGGFPCNLGDMASGASVTVTVTYRVPASYNGPRPISNTATASSSTPDPVPSNNSATETTPVMIPAQERVPVPALGPPGLLGLAGLLALVALYAQRRQLPARRPRR